MERTNKKVLNNAFVKDYYDAQVGALPVSYEEDRWHTSPVKEFEYAQTLRALRHALGKRIYTKGVEIGPGDGVWTKLIKKQVTGDLHLVEQSEEMLSQAKQNLTGVSGITFERNDFLAASLEGNNDLVIAVRCFEYFDDKEGALRKMRDLLAPNGKIIIVTKNSQLFTSRPVQHHTLHSDQLSKKQMYGLVSAAGLSITAAYPAILRWKASWAFMRFFFDRLQEIGVWSDGSVLPPFITYATESYVYILERPRV